MSNIPSSNMYIIERLQIQNSKTLVFKTHLATVFKKVSYQHFLSPEQTSYC